MEESSPIGSRAGEGVPLGGLFWERVRRGGEGRSEEGRGGTLLQRYWLAQSTGSAESVNYVIITLN